MNHNLNRTRKFRERKRLILYDQEFAKSKKMTNSQIDYEIEQFEEFYR